MLKPSPTPNPWKNCLPRNWSLVPKSLGKTALRHVFVFFSFIRGSPNISVIFESESDSHSVVSNSMQPSGLYSPQAPLFMEFSRQEYWSGLPFPSPGDLPDPGIKPRSPALQEDSLPSAPAGKPIALGKYTLILMAL